MQQWQIEMQMLKDRVDQVKRECEAVRRDMPKLEASSNFDVNVKVVQPSLTIHTGSEQRRDSDLAQINSCDSI